MVTYKYVHGKYYEGPVRRLVDVRDDCIACGHSGEWSGYNVCGTDIVVRIDLPRDDAEQCIEDGHAKLLGVAEREAEMFVEKGFESLRYYIGAERRIYL